MALKTYKPTTPGQRQLVLVDRSELYKGKPVKALTEGKSSKGGRNNTGRVTARWQGGGHKQSYRLVDFKRRKLDVPAVVERLEYDPNRSAFIALVKYADGVLSYIIAPQRLAVGDTVIAAVEPDWRQVQMQAIALLARTKDLRPAMLLFRASTRLEGLQGFRMSAQLVSQLLDTYWPALHPLLDADDDAFDH